MTNKTESSTVPFISPAEKGRLEREHRRGQQYILPNKYVKNLTAPKQANTVNDFYKRRLAAVDYMLSVLERLNITAISININGSIPIIRVARCRAVKQLGDAYQHSLRGAPSNITRYIQTTYNGCHIEWQAD